MRADEAPPCFIAFTSITNSKILRNQFQALMPAKVCYNAQADGQDIDLGT